MDAKTAQYLMQISRMSPSQKATLRRILAEGK